MNDAMRAAPADRGRKRVPCAGLARLFATCEWFRALAAEHQAMAVATACAEHLEGGAWIITRRKEPSSDWIGAPSGLIEPAIYSASGRSCTLSGVPPGGWFGEGSVIKRELRKCDAAAIQPSLVMFMAAFEVERHA
jgi:hypothetical protein